MSDLTGTVCPDLVTASTLESSSTDITPATLTEGSETFVLKEVVVAVHEGRSLKTPSKHLSWLRHCRFPEWKWPDI